MPRRLAAEPQLRLVEDPAHMLALGGFTCGNKTHYEREVNQMVADLYAGFVEGPVVVGETEEEELVGLYQVVRNQPYFMPGAWGEPPVDAAKITLVTLAETFRGCRCPDDERLGDFLLASALQDILEAEEEMPDVWAVIARGNQPSKEMFERHAFVCLEANADYYMAIRPSEAAMRSRH